MSKIISKQWDKTSETFIKAFLALEREKVN